MTTASAMTYDSLVQDISNYLERKDAPTLAQIPRWIMLAENRIASEVRGLGLKQVVQGTMTIGDSTLAKPSRWRETASFRATVTSKKKAIYQRSYEYCNFYAPDPSVQGPPRFYSDYDYEHYFVAPAPDLPYVIEITYFERPQPLSSTNQTSWTTQYAPQLLLHATLLEAQPYLKTDDRIAVFQQLYDRASAAVAVESNRRVVDSSSSGTQR